MRAAARGFTLIEVLIALVILSIGLLGVAKLVTGAVHADDSAYMRGQATQLAYELLDMMRANRPGAIAGYYTDPAAYANCANVACSDQTVAALDLYNWQNELAVALPSGTGTVIMNTDAFNDTTATITVSWDDSQAQWAFGTASGVTPGAMSVTLESIL
ncbi:MAG TPA: type IV pilus modification protein PilV [Steroidobacteraceae bacterium]|nr:type IV pilus modification protein PilV [Steroidobacteraceae bacterium]